MRHWLRLMNAGLTLALVAGARPCAAQSDGPPVYSAWWTAGWHAPEANISGLARDRSLLMVGIERRFTLKGGRFGTISMAPAILPAVNATHNRRSEQRMCVTDPVLLTWIYCDKNVPYSAFGVGVLPLAFRFQTPSEHRFGVVASLDGGGVWFDGRIPIPAGTRFNFAARAGLDATVRVGRRTWLSAGVRHLHLSNAGMGDVNPGIDAKLIALGLAWR
jgi:hypothetical protein